jgi:tRNA-uridine 2-sulfurtransferase
MTVRAVALLSGGLDSMLAVRLLQLQGVEVEALNFRTLFACCQDTAAQAAHELGVKLSVVSEHDDYLDLVRRPKYGYGRGANPCVDCRIYMFARAENWMRRTGAMLVASGEVVGQRPMSQKKRDLARIARHSGLEGRLLRPLSAKLLPPTLPEREGLVDRDALCDFSGRGRKGLIALARRLGLKRIPHPSTGCALTAPQFAGKVHDLVQLDPQGTRWDFELLKVGRHVRLDGATKVVLGRREEENQRLQRMFDERETDRAALVVPANFAGPVALLIGPASDEALRFAGGLILRYAKRVEGEQPRAIVSQGDGRRAIRLSPHALAQTAASL